MPNRTFTDITTVKMLLAPVGTALVILMALVDLSEQNVCNLLPPVKDDRDTLSRREQRLIDNDLADNIRTWRLAVNESKPDFEFQSHRSRNKRYLTAPKKVTKVVVREKRSVRPCRKDYRQMTIRQMNRFHQALQLLKDSGVYDDLVNFHTRFFAPAAHNGAAFLPWHREFLYQLEQAMRALGGGFRRVTVPFWDSCMEEHLHDPRDCVVWTNQFWGPCNSPVTSGNLANNWDVTPACQFPGNSKINRQCRSNHDRLLTREKISNDLLPSATFTELTLISPLQGYHGGNHMHVRGHLGNIRCSPNDPIFFLLHGMFDCIWEEWSELPGKINTYPVPGVHDATLTNIGGSIHLGSSPMDPFSLQNIDGLTWDGYTCCAQRPSLIQCGNDADCRSPQGLLFCHQCLCHCKIKSGGNCSGFDDNACYCRGRRRIPRCRSSRCRCVRTG